MPNHAMRICQRPGCGAVCMERYCDKHLFADSRKAARAAFDKKRGSSRSRGYDRRHEAWRKAILARDVLCKINILCSPELPAIATVADHVIPLAAGGDWSLENGQGACASCHSHKTATEDSQFIRKRGAHTTRDRSRRL